MVHTKQDLEDSIREMESVYNDTDTPQNIKDSIKSSLDNAKKLLHELQAAEEKPAEKPTVAQIAKAVKTGHRKVVKAEKVVPMTKTQKKTLRQIVADSKKYAAYAGYSEEQLRRDAERKGKRPGKRVSASGKTYYESRPNRSDVSQKAPHLVKGGATAVKGQLKPLVNKAGGKLAAGGPIGEGKNGYIAFYKGKQVEVMADSSYAAQKKAAEHFKAKKSYDVSVMLAEIEGKQVTHTPDFAEGGEVGEWKKIWFVVDSNNSPKNISTSVNQAMEFLYKALHHNGSIIPIKVPQKDWDAEKVTVGNIKGYAASYYKNYARGGSLRTPLQSVENLLYVLTDIGIDADDEDEEEIATARNELEEAITGAADKRKSKVNRIVEQLSKYKFDNDLITDDVRKAINDFKSEVASFARGGAVHKKPKMIRSIFEEEYFEDYADGGSLENDPTWEVVGLPRAPRNFTPDATAAFVEAIGELEKDKSQEKFYPAAKAALTKLVYLVSDLLGKESSYAAHKMLQEVGMYNYKTGLLLNTDFLSRELSARDLAMGGEINPNFRISIDGEETTLQEFITANTDPDVELLAWEDMKAVQNLELGQSHVIPSHAGYTTITRIEDGSMAEGGELARGGKFVTDLAIPKYLYEKMKAGGVDPAYFKHKVNQLNFDLHEGSVNEEDYTGFTSTIDEVDDMLNKADISGTIYYDNESGSISEYEPDGGYTDEETGEWIEDEGEWYEVDTRDILLGDVAEYMKKGGRLKSALMRDRKYESSQEWEQRYNRKSKPRHPHYKHHMAKGGLVGYMDSVAEKIVSHYLPGAVASEVTGRRYTEPGDYNMDTDIEGDGSKNVFINIYFGDRYKQAEKEIQANYSKYAKYLEDLAAKKGFNAEILTNEENDSVMFKFSNPRTSKYKGGGVAVKKVDTPAQAPVHYGPHIPGQKAKGGTTGEYSPNQFTLDFKKSYPGYSLPITVFTGWPVVLFEKNTALQILKDQKEPADSIGTHVFITVNGKEKQVYSLYNNDFHWKVYDKFKGGGVAAKTVKTPAQAPVHYGPHIPGQKAKGGTFAGKVKAISKNLKGKSVPKKYQGQYGKRYSMKEAQIAARRIAGKMRKKGL